GIVFMHSAIQEKPADLLAWQEPSPKRNSQNT
ncbi:uncharacterized, partial [Tachysurus ichikawai]